MNLPLYLYKGDKIKVDLSKSSNYGLFFERFFDAYDEKYKIDDKTRQEWLKKISKKLGNEGELKQKAVHINRRVTEFNGETRFYACSAGFVSGIGNAHPLENGFSWHHTLGLPYLPGSAVKGLIRAVIETALDDSNENKKALLKCWFGTAEKTDVAEQTGDFIFFDALPAKPCTIKVEVTTPHMGKWYENGSKDPLSPDTMPGDWHSPVPIHWLMATELVLQFAIQPRSGKSTDLKELWQALDYGLKHLGAGAKTAIGYGIFAPDQCDSIAELIIKDKEKIAFEKASEEDRRIIQLRNYLNNIEGIIRPGDGQGKNAVLWKNLMDSIDFIVKQGSPAQKDELFIMIKEANGKKFELNKKNAAFLEKKLRQLRDI